MPEIIDLDGDTPAMDSQHQQHTQPRTDDHGNRQIARPHPTTVIIDDDDDDHNEPPETENSRNPTHQSFNPDDFMTDEDFDLYLTGISETSTAPTSTEKVIIPDFSYQGKKYRRGKSVELLDGTFLRIQDVLCGENNQKIFLRGWRFERLETMDSLMPDRVNELCWIVDTTLEEYNRNATNCEVEIPLENVRGFRIIRLTNHRYLLRDERERTFASLDDFRREGLLFCRLKYIRVSDSRSGGRKTKTRVVENAIVFLSLSECDPGLGMEPDILRRQWRDHTQRGGSYTERTSTGVKSSYTFGDGFCGAGGVSRGALQAGLQVMWGFDICPKAMDTYRLNFETAIGETCAVADFLTNDPKDIRVDIMHLSPPCQTFSSAKTIAAATDDANEACIFAVRKLVEQGRPRVTTMEETSGLQERHKEFLYATLHTFVDLGYSVRWRLLNCEEYGVPQKRKRLIVIASGPGESLPPFPQPTHGESDGESDLLPYRTILDAVAGIHSDAPNHDLERASQQFHRPPYNPRSFAKTLTCSGGENFHPSGTRTFTHREAACLQTFPMEHKFCGVGVMKQIGNAVPPMLGKAILREVIKDLQRTDGLRPRS